MRGIFASVLVAIVSLGLCGVASADVLESGATRLSTLQNDDGGWDWPLDDGNPSTGSAANTIGPIGMGLAQAYAYTGNPTHLAALQKVGTFLLNKTNNFSASDGYLAAELDKVLGGSVYVDHVTTNFYDPLSAGSYNHKGLGTLYDTAGYVNYIRDLRAGQGYANLAAWDVGMGLVGAAAAGAPTSDWIVGTKAEIDELNGDLSYDVLGLAGGLYGLGFVDEDFNPTAGQHEAAQDIYDLADILASYQINYGGFTWDYQHVIADDNNETVQNTAYAILALDAVDRDSYLGNIFGAGSYLGQVQLGTGGWENYVGNGENNEVTGEALWGYRTAVPEPSTLALLGVFGVGGAIAVYRRRRSNQ